MGKEANLWSSTRTRLLEAGFFVQRIETSTGEGVPDVWVGWCDGYAWLENKAVTDFPLQDKTRVFGAKGLNPDQKNWHLEAVRRGVRAFVWASVGTGASRMSFLVPSAFADQFNSFGRQDLLVFSCKVDKLAETLRQGTWQKHLRGTGVG